MNYGTESPIWRLSQFHPKIRNKIRACTKECNWLDLRFFQISQFLGSEKEIWQISSKIKFKDSRGNVDMLLAEPFRRFNNVHNWVREAHLRPRQSSTMELFEK